MAQLLSHRLQALKSRPTKLAASALLLAVIVLVIWLIATASAPQRALCQSPCLCRYCDEPTVNGRCPTSGDGGCIGCAGGCTSPNNCAWSGSSGGCGAVSCGCRDSDCSAGPEPTAPPVTPGAPPPPPAIPEDCPAPGEVREWFNLIEPKLNLAKFEPDHPVVVGQDPDRQGFRLHITGTGGRYEHKQQQLERICDDQPAPINGTPQPCRAWHYECPIRCVACYDDPFAGIEIRMRLADATVDWIEKDLAGRYYGAARKEGLPRTWQRPGVNRVMWVDQWWTYAPGQPDVLSNGPLDPGIHGGVIAGWTTGTPKSAPQRVAAPFAVPVYLLDTTIGQ